MANQPVVQSFNQPVSQSLSTGFGVTVVISATGVTIIQPFGGKQDTIQRVNIASVELKRYMVGFFGIGSSKHVIIRTNDRRHVTITAKPKQANAIVAALR